MSPNLVTRIATFTRSPQGRALADTAVRQAREPKTRRQVEQVRQRLAQVRRTRGATA
jgi:hypothetical protein